MHVVEDNTTQVITSLKQDCETKIQHNIDFIHTPVSTTQMKLIQTLPLTLTLTLTIS